MYVVWNPDFRYRTFIHKELGVATLVSSNLQDEVVGQTVGGVWLIATQPDGTFCDFELKLLPEAQARIEVCIPESVDEACRPVQVRIDAGANVVWAFEGDVLEISLGGDPDYWTRLGSDTLVFIGMSSDNKLRKVVVTDVIDDPHDKAEENWLDEIGVER